MNINPRIAIVGATGMVGRTFLKVLEERQLRARDYVLFASGKSAGTELDFMYKKYVVQELREDSFDSGFDIALFFRRRRGQLKVCSSCSEPGLRCYRQQLRLAHGPLRSSGGAGGKLRGHKAAQRDYRQPQLQCYTRNRCPEAAL